MIQHTIRVKIKCLNFQNYIRVLTRPMAMAPKENTTRFPVWTTVYRDASVSCFVFLSLFAFLLCMKKLKYVLEINAYRFVYVQLFNTFFFHAYRFVYVQLFNTCWGTISLSLSLCIVM